MGHCTLNRGDRDWERVAGACATGRGTDGFATICSTQGSSSGPAATLGIEAFTLGKCVVFRAAGVALTLLRFSLAFADSFFAAAIFVKSLLTFFNASAISLPAGILPLSAVASCWAAATT
jgi:hypothetical protein